ncbi:MAG TPA: hypothetical protein VGC20_02315 [bacterium]
MTFTKQDALTFVLGLGAAVLFELGLQLLALSGLLQGYLDGGMEIDWTRFGVGVAIAELTAVGRYLTTRIPEWLLRRQAGG